jgi:hypothetical protein
MKNISETLFIWYDSDNGEDPACLSVVKRTGNTNIPFQYLNTFYGEKADQIYNQLIIKENKS